MNDIANLTLHHIGLVTKDINNSISFFRRINYQESDIYIDHIQNVKIALLTATNSTTIELVEPLSITSPVTSLLKKNGNTPYHLCYETENIEETIIKFRKLNFIKLFNPVPAVAFQGKLICYLYNSNVGLIELINI